MTLALSVSDLGLVVSLLCFLIHKTRMLAVDLKKKNSRSNFYSCDSPRYKAVVSPMFPASPVLHQFYQ